MGAATLLIPGVDAHPGLARSQDSTNVGGQGWSPRTTAPRAHREGRQPGEEHGSLPRLQGQAAEVGSKEPLGRGTRAAFLPAQAQVTGGSSVETLETMQTDYRIVRSPRDKDENDLVLFLLP